MLRFRSFFAGETSYYIEDSMRSVVVRSYYIPKLLEPAGLVDAEAELGCCYYSWGSDQSVPAAVVDALEVLLRWRPAPARFTVAGAGAYAYDEERDQRPPTVQDDGVVWHTAALEASHA